MRCIKDDFDAIEHEQMKTGVWSCPCKPCQDALGRFEDERYERLKEA